MHSFDLVSVNAKVTACDIAAVPLPDASVDAVVLSLALMGLCCALSQAPLRLRSLVCAFSFVRLCARARWCVCLQEKVRETRKMEWGELNEEDGGVGFKDAAHAVQSRLHMLFVKGAHAVRQGTSSLSLCDCVGCVGQVQTTRSFSKRPTASPSLALAS